MLESRKLYDHQIDAIIDAIATIENIEMASKVIKPSTTSILRGIIGLRGEMPEYMNKVIAEFTEKEGCRE